MSYRAVAHRPEQQDWAVVVAVLDSAVELVVVAAVESVVLDDVQADVVVLAPVEADQSPLADLMAVD